MQMFSTTRRRKAASNWPLYALSMTVLAAVEAFSAFGILKLNQAQETLFGVTYRLAYVEVAITLFLSLLSFWVATAGARMANDPRPDQKRRAAAATLLSLALLWTPATYFAKGFAMPRQIAEHAAYVGSDAMEADKAIIADPMADSQAKLQAAESLKQAQPPTKAQPTLAEFFKAFVIHASIWLCGFVALLAPAETDAQRKDREKAERAAKAQATRQRNKALKEKAQARSNVIQMKKQA